MKLAAYRYSSACDICKLLTATFLMGERSTQILRKSGTVAAHSLPNLLLSLKNDSIGARKLNDCH
jgi:hypothetical protein